MRIVIAVETWAPAHAGPTGAAWWLAHGLAARGHRVVVTAATAWNNSFSPVAVELLDPRWPTASAASLSEARLAHTAHAVPSIQREILHGLGADTDAATVDLRHTDGLIGVGLRSPHVRGLLRRARGRTATMVQLVGSDAEVVRLPVVATFLRGHVLVSHWGRLAQELSPESGPVEILLGGMDPPAPSPLPEEDAAAVGIAHQDSAAPCVLACPSEYDPSVAAAAAAVRARALHPVKLSATDLAGRRVDRLVVKAVAVVIGDGDSGDLADVALRHGRPVVVTTHSSGSAVVTASGAGWVVDEPGHMAAAMEEALDDQAGSRSLQGLRFAVDQEPWDRGARRYEELLGQAAPSSQTAGQARMAGASSSTSDSA